MGQKRFSILPPPPKPSTPGSSRAGSQKSNFLSLYHYYTQLVRVHKGRSCKRQGLSVHVPSRRQGKFLDWRISVPRLTSELRDLGTTVPGATFGKANL